MEAAAEQLDENKWPVAYDPLGVTAISLQCNKWYEICLVMSGLYT